jgi:hypothetical protein
MDNRHTENIERFLGNSMSKAEEKRFLQKVDADPDLKDQLNFQRDIVNGIQQYRKMELKGRLANIPITGPAGFLQTVASIKTAGVAVVGSGLIMTGVYLYQNQQNTSDTIISEEMVVGENAREPIAVLEDAVDAENSASDLMPKENVDSEKATEPADQSDQSIQAKIAAEKTTDLSEHSREEYPVISSSEAKATELDAFEPELIDDFDDAESLPSARSLKRKAMTDNSETSMSSVSIEKVDDGIHEFHYRYFNNKLYLYGKFEESPYEIIEINPNNERRLFLYYNGTYFEIADNQKDISRLRKVTGHRMIEKLDSMR